MIKINLSNILKRQLLYYAEKEFHQGHWGDGELVIPEHQILYELIQKTENEVELTLLQYETICIWISEGTKSGRLLSPEDILTIDEIKKPLEEYYNKIKVQYSSEIKKLENQIDLLNNLRPKEERIEVMNSDSQTSKKSDYQINTEEIKFELNEKLKEKRGNQFKFLSRFLKTLKLEKNKIKVKSKKEIEKEQFGNVINLAKNVEKRAKKMK